jgi:hypothetical protein
MEELTAHDPHLVPGALGGSSGKQTLGIIHRTPVLADAALEPAREVSPEAR